MIRITNTETGETKVYKGTLMVAPNGMVFIKGNKKTIWASASTDFVAVDLDEEKITKTEHIL